MLKHREAKAKANCIGTTPGEVYLELRLVDLFRKNVYTGLKSFDLR